MKTTLSINPNVIDINEAYMQMAEIWAKRSKANRKQVGCIIVKDTQIISDGYNGMPSGDLEEVCEYIHIDEESGIQTIRSKPEVLHAESNAIAKLARFPSGRTDGAILYVTLSPCLECAKLMKQSGISKVYYREQYRDSSGIDFLQKRNIEVIKL